MEAVFKFKSSNPWQYLIGYFDRLDNETDENFKKRIAEKYNDDAEKLSLKRRKYQ